MRQFGEFSPDLSDLNTDTLDIARNVLPGPNSYLPAPGLVAHSVTALPLPCRGLWYVQTAAGDYDTYAATAEKLYKYEPDTGTFADVSRLVGGNYALPTDDYWSGTQYGNRLIVCNGGNEPQFIDVDSGANFADLPNAPIASFVTVMDDHVVFSRLFTNPRAIRWSAINDSEDYTSGTAGFQEFSDAGEVTGFCANAHILFLQRGLRGIISTGDKYAFSFPTMSSEKGTVSPFGVIEFGGIAYWLSDNGFYVGNADQQKSISEKRISGYFYDALNQGAVTRVFSTFDPHASRIYWTYAVGDEQWNDRVLVYDWGIDRWSELEVNTYILSRLATASVSLDSAGPDPMDMDLPGLPSLDSFIYRSGAPVLAAVGTDLQLSTMEGPNLAATLLTGSHEFQAGRRVRMRSVLTYIEESRRAEDGLTYEPSTITVKVSKRQRYGDDWLTSSAIPQQRSGYYRMNADGHFHRFQIDIPAGTDWQHAAGWEADFVPTTGR
jgi:hypothetical protein